MSKEEYKAIINKLRQLNTCEEKRDYLDSVIPSIDSDNNGFVDELIRLRNKLNDKCPKKLK